MMYEGLTIDEYVLRLRQLVREALTSGIDGELIYECSKDIIALPPEHWADED